LSAMQLDKLLGERQSKSGPLDLMRIVTADLAKLLEYLGLVRFSDADAGVGYGNLHSTVDRSSVNPNPSTLRRELYRIGKQIKKDLFDLSLVANDVANTLVNF